MYCNHCSSEVKETDKFCPNCGQPVSSQQTNISNLSQNSGLKPLNETKTLVLGIVGFVCTLLNFLGIPAIHILGIVLGGYGISLAKKDKEVYGNYSRPGLLLSWIAVGLGVFAFIYGAVFVLLNPEVVPQ